MAERADLDAAFADLATTVAWPATPDLVTTVAVALERPDRGRGWATPWPRALAIAIVATLILAAAVAAAVLVLPGLRLTFVPTLPPVAQDPLGSRLALGERVAPGDVAVNVPAALGEPDEIYVNAAGDVVTLVYAASDDLPEVADTGIGLILQEIRGDLDRERVEKLVVEAGAIVTPANVGGADGLWITGPPHVVRYRDANGVERGEMTRLVGDTLVWQAGDVLFRMESGLGMDATVAIGASIPPPGTQ